MYETKRIYEEVRCDYENDGFWYVDAWHPGNEKGETIAYIDSLTARIIHCVPEARFDTAAVEEISAKVEEIKAELAKKAKKSGVNDYELFKSRLLREEYVLIYVPSAENPYIRVSLGTGDNLGKTSHFAGYLNIESYKLHIEVATDSFEYPPGFDYEDGGTIMLMDPAEDMPAEKLLKTVSGISGEGDFVVLDTIL